MKIPKNIKIGWRDYKIKFTEERRDDEGNLLDGEIDYLNHIIYIDNNLPSKEETIIAFLHEVVHGIFNSQCHSDWANNEDLVEAVSEGLFQLIVDNPKLFK